MARRFVSFLRALPIQLLLIFGHIASAHADDSLSLTASQLKALRIATYRVADGGEAASSAFPARVVVPNAQMRVLAAPLSGTVAMLAVEVGSAVRRGQVLARLNSPEALALQRDALQSSSQSSLLQESLRRDEVLFKEGLIAESRLQATRSAAAQAAAQAGERRQGLALAGVAGGQVGGPLTLVAPIDGVVLEQGVQLGQRVEASAMLYRIARLSSLWLEVQVPLALTTQVREGQTVRVTGSGAEGKVIAVGRAVDPVSQSVLIRAAVAQDAAQLKPGQMVEVTLTGTTGGGIRVPAAAVARQDGQSLVFVETEHNQKGSLVVTRPVRILAQAGDSLLVAGLKPGETIITSGTSGLKAMLTGIGKE